VKVRLAAAVFLAACGGDAPSVEIIVDTPAESSGAYPYEGLDTLLLSVARSGDDLAIQEVAFAADQSAGLQEVPFGSDLVVHLSGRAGAVESAYGRTCAFDVLDGEVSVAEPHLYFSRIVKWAAAPEPLEPTRSGGAGYALPDGRAVFFGGAGGSGVERFDPLETGTFSPLDAEPTSRLDALVAPLADGRSLIIGGADAGGDAVDTIEVLDPRVSPGPAGRVDVGPAGLPLRGHAGSTLVDGTVLVAGGAVQAAPGAPFALTSSAFVLRFGDGGQLEPPRQLSATLDPVREHHSMTRLGDDVGASVLIAGGRDAAGLALGEARLYRPLGEVFESVNDALTVPRWDHAAVRLPGGFVLVVGGVGDAGPVRELEVYDPVQGQFIDAGVLPAGAGLTGFSTTAIPDGRILIAGGLDETGAAVSSVFLARLDPRNGRVDLLPSDALSVPRAGHSAVQLCDGTILVVGGSDNPSVGAERYNPPSANRR